MGFRQIESQFHCVPLYIRDVLAIPFKEGKAGTFVYFPLSKKYIYKRRPVFERISRFYSPILAFCATIFCSTVPSSIVQWIEGERCLRAYVGDLKTCMGAIELGLWEVRSHNRSRSSSPTVPSLHFCRIHCK
jgi:hypothetical protein